MRALVACAGPGWEPHSGVCGACGATLQGRSKWFCNEECARYWRANHWWSAARAVAIQHQKRCCRCGYQKELEVNHITPRNGAGYETSCAHHQDGLEVLCHQHHLIVTAQQRYGRVGSVAVEAERQGALL